jgi:hypothetical protein
MTEVKEYIKQTQNTQQMIPMWHKICKAGSGSLPTEDWNVLNL